jgi:thiamine pyrophosphate-dependent acetolactate synthase large subunit-like protein/nitrite reductase/ring-hydroxylating ferredoxin subunit
MAATTGEKLVWCRVLNLDELPEGRVKTVTAAHRQLAMTHFEGQYAALDNRCPHQGGPLGEGSIEHGWLRCPWHGWDFHPCTGKPPGDFDDGIETFAVEVRDDGVYVGVPEENPRVRTVSDVMVETMVNWGVTHVFGMVGHSNLGLADAFRVQEAAGNLTYVGIRHEGAASFAASAYAKLTGRPAACFSIAGPGATNLLTGLWDAKVDRAPILALTGQIDTQVLGPGAFQEIDLSSAFNSVAAWSQTVLHQSKHAELMTLALKHANLHRDVAHLIFPNEVQTIPAGSDAKPSRPSGRVPALEFSPPQEAVDEALVLMRQAKRPVIVVGHGARFHMPAVITLAESLNAPVVTTFKGKGLIADDHPLGCGVLGRSGTPIASWFMNESDLLVVFGASFSNHTGITPKKPIIQVDFEPMALGKFHAVRVPVLGDIGVTARLLQRELGSAVTEDQRPEVAQRWKIWRMEKARRIEDDRGMGVNSAAVFAAMAELMPEDAVIAVDVGNNTYSFGRYFECKRQAILMSGYLGSIGFGYPAAMGAWAAAPDRPIVAVTGDGGFGQYMGELTTAVKYDMNITHVLLNNNELGKISKEQRADRFDVWQTSLVNPNFADYARLCGALGERVTSQSELRDALSRALAHLGPAMVEVMTDPELI